jgi:hypothetical protein
MEEMFRLGRIAGMRVGVNWSVLVILRADRRRPNR